MKTRGLVLTGVLALALGCGGDDPDLQSSNNGANNGANNGTANNGANNGTANNGVNNGSANNGASNNGANNGTNNGVTNGSNNGTAGTNNSTGGTNNNTNPIACAGDFGANEACGGDLVGTWNVDSACTNEAYEETIKQYCSDAVINDIAVTANGTLTVDASTYTQDVSGQVDVEMYTASGCGIGNCSFVQTALGALGDATCTDNANGGCDCTASVTFAQSATGTYQTDGNGVATIDSGETYYYCVEQDTLTQRRFGTQADDVEPTVTYTK